MKRALCYPDGLAVLRARVKEKEHGPETGRVWKAEGNLLGCTTLLAPRELSSQDTSSLQWLEKETGQISLGWKPLTSTFSFQTRSGAGWRQITALSVTPGQGCPCYQPSTF